MVPVTMIVRDDRPPGHANTKRDQWRHRIVYVGWRRIIDRGRIGRHINDLRIGRCYLHDLVRNGHYLGIIGLDHYNVRHGNDLLGCGPKCAGFFCFGTQRLDRVHQLLRLIQKGLT